MWDMTNIPLKLLRIQIHNVQPTVTTMELGVSRGGLECSCVGGLSMKICGLAR